MSSRPDLANDPYAESIDPSVHCNTCEAVCCRLTVYILAGDVVPSWLTVHDEHGMEQMERSDDGWCVALDRNTMRCTIYDARPGVCRKFAMGGPYCRDERDTWFGKPGGGIAITVVADHG